LIGWKDEFPKDFKDVFIPDMKLMFTKTVMAPMKRIVDIHKWTTLHPDDDMECDISKL
jgi:hypothetical protein